MAATLSATVAAFATSAEVTVTPNAIFSVQSTRPVNVESKLLQSTPDAWLYLGQVGGAITQGGVGVFIATSATIRINNINGPDAADIEVFA